MRKPELVVAPDFKDRLEELRQNLPHAIILSGQVGTGLLRLAKDIAGLGALIIEPSEATKTTRGSIGIDVIRSLYTETRGSTSSRQVVIIDDADRMSIPAQNAFLKLLEEPGRNIHFILTTHIASNLLSTITSRAQTIRVPHITDQQSRQLLDVFRLDDAATRQLLFIAGGRPAELVRLAQNPRARDELIQLISDARVVLGSDRYQAYYTALRYGDTLVRAERLLAAVRRLLEHAIQQAPNQQLVARLSQLVNAHDHLQNNTNPKLQLARFVIQYQ